MVDTNKFFTPGKLTVLMDAQAGSSGKGKIGSYITQNADNWQFACNAFYPNAGHWVKLDDGRSFFYQSLNSCAYQKRYEKMYIGPGAIIELPALLREIEENGVSVERLGIDPHAVILQDIDKQFETGVVDFEGRPLKHEGTSRFGSTSHGCGAANARRVLRRPDLVTAGQTEKLKRYLCDVPNEIMERLKIGQAGFLEVAQGFQLSLLGRFFPNCTSRNCTVSQALSDMFLPPSVAGSLILNFRTFPIRINSNKYIAEEDGRHLTWYEIQNGVPHHVYEGDSGAGYPDQEEITWDKVTVDSGSKIRIMEMTSVTKLPRRVFTFSIMNMMEALKYNSIGGMTYLSLNFVNYIDANLTGCRGTYGDLVESEKFLKWMKRYDMMQLFSIFGTGQLTDDIVLT